MVSSGIVHLFSTFFPLPPFFPREERRKVLWILESEEFSVRWKSKVIIKRLYSAERFIEASIKSWPRSQSILSKKMANEPWEDLPASSESTPRGGDSHASIETFNFVSLFPLCSSSHFRIRFSSRSKRGKGGGIGGKHITVFIPRPKLPFFVYFRALENFQPV